MSSDFYKRTKELFEEFQNRELQYLKAETATRSHFQVINMPVHEYLEKLNKREKETEEEYLELMHHMEQLDHRTESIKEKLQKLESLRMSMSSKASVWPYSMNANANDDKSFYNYTRSSSVLKTDHTLSDTYLQPNQFVLPKEKVTECASTQTDVMFCENCQFPITLFTERPSDFLSSKNPLNTIAPPFQNSSFSSQVVETETAFGSNLPTQALINNDETTLNINRLEKLEELPIAPSLSKLHEEAPFQIETSRDTNSTDISPPMAPNIKFLENKVTTSTTSVSTTSDKQLKADIPTTTDHNKSVSNEKLNEKAATNISNRKESSSNLHSNIVPETFDQSAINKDSDLTATIVIDDLSTLSINQSIPLVESEGEISTSKINTRKSALGQDGLSDRRSESPISIGGIPSPSLQSENVSAVSDSDSFDEKGGLKESAAYQALLGKAPLTKKVQKTAAYESDSEDEVEKALANAARKSSSVPTTTILQETKPDDSHKKDDEEPKAKTEPRKSISLVSGSKPQQLSKTTRKVLGMDTSSGSEGEIQIAAKPSQKIEEDSDEFDFYD